MPKEKVNCVNCGKAILRWPYQIREHNKFFCSDDCESEYKKKALKGENNPCWRGGRNSVKANCDYCGKEFELRKDRLQNHQHNFCSMECKGKFRVEEMNFLGEKNPAWKDGRTLKSRSNSGYNWNNIKDKIKEEREYRCEKCKRKESEVNGYLNIHHIKDFRSFDSSKEANKKENLLVLCPKCHKETHIRGD